MSTDHAAQNRIDLTHRLQRRENAVGISGIDHVGVATRDPLAAALFVEEILGGILCMKAGYSEEDIRLGRPRHIFYYVGDQIVEVAEQKDASTGYPSANTKNDQPHWAFGTTAAGLKKFVEHLRKHEIPFDGPRSHGGMSAVSVYFRDPDGNNMEVSTWEEFPADESKPMGGKHGFPQWEALSHNWRSKRAI